MNFVIAQMNVVAMFIAHTLLLYSCQFGDLGDSAITNSHCTVAMVIFIKAVTSLGWNACNGGQSHTFIIIARAQFSIQ